MRRGFLAWKRLGRRDNTRSARRASARRASARRGAAGAAARLRLPSARPAALRAAQNLKLPGTTRAAQDRETKGGLFRSLQLAPRRSFAPKRRRPGSLGRAWVRECNLAQRGRGDTRS